MVVIGMAVALIPRTPSVMLVADTAVPVYDIASADPAVRRVIDTIDIGQSVVVVGCTDLKHYLVPEVSLRDGRRGHVIEGDFTSGVPTAR
ncbi:hypothetical protein [Piscinibacter sp. XHJ-5]|uniref:hypothetical protein n=1 Tax=Piscinibacter sp. XHJ-5 TaxID=3037797 RepID=UPI002452C245|nr:hypothetical protein [Piscinibacter sp. XHJ-5]